MTKKKEIAKVPDKALEKLQDSISFECTKKNGEQFLLLKATEETVFNATGFKKKGSVANILLAITNTLLNSEDNFEKKNVKGNQILSAMTELNPRDGHEGMLISQMLVTYDRAMYCFRMADDNKSCAEMYFSLQNQGVKLMRLYTQQLEALDKHRRKGNQKMIVEHVHVHKGGQAIVGNVNHKGGGGIKLKNKKQPQGKRRKKLQFGHLKNDNPPCDLRAMPKCQAVAKTTGRRCGNIAIKGKNVCYLHGGKSPGAPKRNMNALKHGRHTAKSIAERRYMREYIKEAHRLIKEITA